MKPIQLTYNYQIPPLSIGWYVIAETKEIKKGQILSRTFAGQEVVVFKTEAGKIAVLDAYCPHMGAHLGHGGKIVDETIICPFHGFCFDAIKGNCIKSGYDTKTSSKTKVFSWPTKVTGGLVFCYYHPNRAVPTWEIEDLEEEGWTDFKIHTWTLKSNVVEITENSVDIGHFYWVHKYENPYIIHELKREGPILRASYGMKRLGKFGSVNELDTKFHIFQQGLGIAVVDTEVSPLNMNTRHLVLATPIDGETIYLRIGAAVKEITQPSKIHPLATLVPKQILMKIIHHQVFKGYIHDVFQDFEIWKNKKYVHPPLLAKGDGPIMQYREWAAQFDFEFMEKQAALNAE